MSARGASVDANGVHGYVEQCSSGEPLLLLHGSFETVEILPQLTAALAERYHVVAPERRGHGRTADVPGIGRAHLVGYSDGTNIAMLLAIAHPERVAWLVLVNGNFDARGMTPAFRRALHRATAETYEPALAAAYRRLSPDGPAHWPIVFAKLQRMILEEPARAAADLAGIAAPALVLAGDRDFVTVGHSVALSEAIAGARLCIVPGGSYGLLTEQPALVMGLIIEFLGGQADAVAR